MTGWAWTALGFVGGLALTVLGDLVSEEIRGWLDLAPRAILRPTFLRCAERASWLAHQHGLSAGYARAIVHEYEVQRRGPLFVA